jgi:hypothetical protein
VVQIGPNQITYGYYTIANSILTMCHDDGRPVNVDGMTFTHTLKESDAAEPIAAVFTGKIRKMLIGEKVSGFNDVLSYPQAGIA